MSRSWSDRNCSAGIARCPRRRRSWRSSTTPDRSGGGSSAGPPPRVIPSGRRARELLERADLARRTQRAAQRRPRHLGHVEVAAGVDGAAVRRDELTGRLASEAIPDPAHQITLARQDAHAISDVGDLRVHGERGAELADVEEIALPAVREHPARPVQVLPLPLIASSVVEDLDAVVLAVGDVYETLGVGGDVMGN